MQKTLSIASKISLITVAICNLLMVAFVVFLIWSYFGGPFELKFNLANQKEIKKQLEQKRELNRQMMDEAFEEAKKACTPRKIKAFSYQGPNELSFECGNEGVSS